MNKKNSNGLGAVALVLALLLSATRAPAQQLSAITVKAAATPQFSLPGGTYRMVQSISISDATAGASIYYTTDGTTPSKSSTAYTGAIAVSATETIKAIAVATGFSRSLVAQANYKINLPAATPMFSPGAGSYGGPQNVSISDATDGAVIHYTTDGSLPGTASTVYAAPITISSTETLKAIAIATGGSRSLVASGLYQIVLAVTAAPVFSPPAGTYDTAQDATIADVTPGATIFYTTDGTTPTIDSTQYTDAILVSSTDTLKAVAIAPGCTQSQTAAATYLIMPQSIAETVLYSFSGGAAGKTPIGSLVQGIDGNFAGTSYQGGTNAVGTVFSITPAGMETVLHSFTGGARGSFDGELPFTTLVQGSDGIFYGTTELGGAHGAGIVFQVTPDGIEAVLHSFGGTQNGAPDGAFPQAGLIQGSDGNLYGTTAGGGATQAGTVFEITPLGQETVLYSFGAGGNLQDGLSPRAGLVQAVDGNFYGTTVAGGINDDGTVFELTPDGAETVLYSFSYGGDSADGEEPAAALIQGSDGNFYGTTTYGGVNDSGTVFQLAPLGSETVLHSFGVKGGSDGAYPVAPLIQASDGNFYGTTTGGNPAGTGTVFQITADGTETVLYSFAAGNGSTDGANPHASLLQADDGNFYGTTDGGGEYGAGSIFELTPPSPNGVRHSLAAPRQAAIAVLGKPRGP